MAFAWYVAAVRPFSEMIAEESLGRLGIQSFNPKCRSVRVIRGRRQITDRPYITGYIFPRFDIEDDSWRLIHTQRGIHRLLSLDAEHPSPVRDAAMQALLDKCKGEIIDEVEADAALSRFIPVGSLVRVSSGPFEGHSGIVKMSARDRISVLLGMFGREMCLPFASNNVVVV